MNEERKERIKAFKERMSSSDGWEFDPVTGRYFRNLGNGCIEYKTDMIFKGSPEVKKPTEKRPRKLCPMTFKELCHCKDNCVCFTSDGCGIVTRKYNVQRGRWCPYLSVACVGELCSWWGSYGSCIMFKEDENGEI